MRNTMLAAAAALLVLTGPAQARRGDDDRVTEAPLPLAGAGLVGLLLAGGAGGIATLVRRQRDQRNTRPE